MSERPYNVLFLCTGNSARSIIAESLLNYRGVRRFRAFSAGSRPRRQVHPLALETLRRMHIPTAALRSKSRDEFAIPGTPPLDFVFTVCDDAAKEVCPIWPGQPMTAHWGVADPAAAEGSEEARLRAFELAYQELDARVTIFLSLQLDVLDRISVQRRLDEIGGHGQTAMPATLRGSQAP
jgi:arsenate reductase